MEGNFVASQEPGFVVIKITHNYYGFFFLALEALCVCVTMMQGVVRELKAERDGDCSKPILVKGRGWKCWRFRNTLGKRFSSQSPSTQSESLGISSLNT